MNFVEIEQGGVVLVDESHVLFGSPLIVALVYLDPLFAKIILFFTNLAQKFSWVVLFGSESVKTVVHHQ